MRSTALYFVAPRSVETREEELREPSEGEVLVEADVSAISAGTELLLYRGELDEGTRLDETLPSLSDGFHYPFRYGYAAAGRIVALGAKVPAALRDRRVFAFEPHGSHFLARADGLVFVPENVSQERAALLPSVETAANLVLDGRPLIGERVLVVGQGVVGLVTTSILARFPLARLVTSDPIDARRRVSERLGAHASVRPEELGEGDFDLTFELSGSPAALTGAIATTGNEGRLVVGSWYGNKSAEIGFGTHFHRGRLTVISSQVSHLAPCLSARWDERRRVAVAFEHLATLPLEGLVTHRVGISEAADAYRLLDQHPESCLQVLLSYT
jgi:2-desacetyl-2-hydroxyethyl bacteriochlorophyllide A dehydrogenase